MLPFIFLIVLVINLAIGKTAFEKAKDIRDHQSLGSALLETNQIDEAEREFKIISSPSIAKIAVIKSQPQKIAEEISFWQKIVTQFPNYRDAYLKLAVLNLQLNHPTEAKMFLDKALQIDPNNEVAKQLMSGI